MRILKHVLVLIVLFLPAMAAAGPVPVLHHELRVTPDVRSGTLQVEDTLSVPDSLRHNGQFIFTLNPAFRLEKDTSANTTQETGRYSIPVSDGQREITLKYSGKLASTDDCAWLTQACILLNERGIYLDGNSQWYPQSGDTLHSFGLHIALPEG